MDTYASVKGVAYRIEMDENGQVRETAVLPDDILKDGPRFNPDEIAERFGEPPGTLRKVVFIFSGSTTEYDCEWIGGVEVCKKRKRG